MSSEESPDHNPSHKDAETFKIIGFVLPFAGMSIPGLIFSIIAYKQLQKTGQPKRMAVAGIWLGAIFTFLSIAYMVFFFTLFFRHI